VRHRLPGERASVTHKFGIAGHEGYITVGLYPNGSPGEIFIRMAKEGSTVSGLMDSFATAISISLQHGVPLRVLCEKFAHTRFEPSGWTGNAEIGYAKSIMDYIFRWIQMRFLSGTQLDLFAGLTAPASVPVEGTVTAPGNTVSLAASSSGEEHAIASGAKGHGVAGENVEHAAVEAEHGSHPANPPATEGDLLSDQPLLRSGYQTVNSALAAFSTGADASPQAILQREQREARGHQSGDRSLSDQDIFDNGAPSFNREAPNHHAGGVYDRARTMSDAARVREEGGRGEYGARSHHDDRMPPQHGIAPEPSAVAKDLSARSGMAQRGANGQPSSSFEDRGLYHAADRMKEMYDMGDAPSCATCGAIMTRSGSCYRCMSCGSTSGCS
jgi:hypothetical protein